MNGNPANAPVFSDYEVWVGGVTAALPVAPASFTKNATSGGTSGVVNAWDYLGLLDDDAPFDGGEESIDKTEHSAAGFGVYATTYKNQVEKITFTALESTLITLGFIYDPSGLTNTSGTISGVVKRRNPNKKYRIGFRATDGTTLEHRASKNYGYVDSITRAFADGRKTYAVTSVIVPTQQNELYDYYLGPVS